MYTYTYRFPFVESSSNEGFLRDIDFFRRAFHSTSIDARVFNLLNESSDWRERRIIEISNKIVRCNEEFQGLLFNLTIIFNAIPCWARAKWGRRGCGELCGDKLRRR